MGCMYCYSVSDEPMVYIFDPASMETSDAETKITDFFNIDLVKHRNETLFYSRFKSIFKKLKIDQVEVDKCLGYSESLFLGGDDDDNNFSIQDLEVYWELQHKIYEKIKDLPDGASVSNINFED
jgi:hypothetical protein